MKSVQIPTKWKKKNHTDWCGFSFYRQWSAASEHFTLCHGVDFGQCDCSAVTGIIEGYNDFVIVEIDGIDESRNQSALTIQIVEVIISEFVKEEKNVFLFNLEHLCYLNICC